MNEILKNELLRKAANASSEGITISTMANKDRPLIYVNEGFQRLTGYSADEVIGKNCRFLQGEGTDKATVQRLKDAIKKGEDCVVELLNYRKDGSTFWNRLSITPIKDDQNIVTHYVGIQSDISQLNFAKQRLTSANNTLQIFQNRILRELEQAKIAQQFLLPNHLPKSQKVHFSSFFKPMDAVGGDFYDVIELPNGKYGLLIADVTGHGIPAALLTFMSSTTFKNAAEKITSPADIINLTNQRLYQNMPGDAFVTMFYAEYNSNNGVLTYVSAGHPEGYILRGASEEVISISTEGTIIGVFSKEEVLFKEKQIQLNKGDKLILYTDAITDVMDQYDVANPDGLTSILHNNMGLSLEELFQTIYQYGLQCSKLTSYSDDFTLLGMEVL